MKTDDKIKDFKKYIKKQNLSDNQKKDLIDYSAYLFDNNSSEVTVRTRIVHVKTFLNFIKKDFKEITKEDIKEYVSDIQGRLKPNSYNGIKNDIRLFFKWLHGIENKGEYPEIVKWIIVKNIEQPELLKEDLISFEETRNILIPACHNFQEKFLVFLMRETGARINEILKANVEDVRLEDDKAFIKLLNSKRKNNIKNYREIVLIDSFYYLQSWLRDHPFKNKFSKEKDIPLFVNKRKKRMAYNNVDDILKRIKKETNFNKSLTPHKFRHAQANDMSKILTDAELRIFGGWAKSSNVIARYTHLTSDDVNKKRLGAIGRIKPKEAVIQKENLKHCPRCNEMVDYNKFKFCGKCGMSLSKEEIKENIKMEILNKKVDKLFKQLKEMEKEKVLKYINIKEKKKVTREN